MPGYDVLGAFACPCVIPLSPTVKAKLRKTLTANLFRFISFSSVKNHYACYTDLLLCSPANHLILPLRVSRTAKRWIDSPRDNFFNPGAGENLIRAGG